MTEIRITSSTAPACCGAPNIIPYTHRSPGSPYKNQKLCFNGLLKADHLCIAECRKPGTLCLNCRLMTDLFHRMDPTTSA